MKIYQLVALTMLIATAAFGRDGYQGRPTVCDMPQGPRQDTCVNWVSTVKTNPPYRGSCCGMGDTYMADDFRAVDGGYIAIVSADYPDAPDGIDDDGNATVGTKGLKRGDEIFIPQEKVNYLPEDANKSGHGVFFWANGNVFCAFLPPLT